MTAAIAVGGAVAAPTASAQTYSCTFTGLPVNVTPPILPAPALGGAGVYDGGGRALSCSYANPGTGTLVPSTGATIATSGRYVNEVCGTGLALSHTAMRPVGTPPPGTYVDLDDPRAPNITQLDYRIEFVKGNGVLRGGDLVGGTLNAQFGWKVTGAVNIRPANQGGCVTAPVSTFIASGHFTAARS